MSLRILQENFERAHGLAYATAKQMNINITIIMIVNLAVLFANKKVIVIQVNMEKGFVYFCLEN